MTGDIFDIKRFAVHDGPGIRCTVFLKGCPLDCVWCHNPEGKRLGLEIGYFPFQCIDCGACFKECQSGGIKRSNGSIAIDRDRCTRCGKCSEACPPKAIITKGGKTTVDALMKEFSKEEVFFQSSGGGITLSGGEPLFQPEFTAEILRIAKVRGYHTAVETCLHTSFDIFNMFMDMPDLWIVDLKILDDDEHKKMTGRTNRLILKNYERLAASRRPMLTRIPVVPDCTDSEENLTSLGQYISKVNYGGKVELIFYNPLAESKYKNFDIGYTLFGSAQYTAERQNDFRKMVAATGVCVI